MRMRKSLLFKYAFVILAVMVLFAWAGQIFDDNEGDSPNISDYLPAVFFTGELFGFGPVFAHCHGGVSHPIIQESFASYLEMREKSPPLTPVSF